VTEACGNLETYSEIDKDLADLNGNTAAFRLGEDQAFIEGMSQDMQAAVCCSNAISTPSQIMGLAPALRLADGCQHRRQHHRRRRHGQHQHLDVADRLAPQHDHRHLPRGKMAALQQRDLGEDTKVDSNGGLYQVYRSHFKWECGLAVRDWRYAVRICNIDVTLLGGGSAANLINALVSACHRVPVAPNGARIQTMPTDPSGIVTMAPRWASTATASSRRPWTARP